MSIPGDFKWTEQGWQCPVCKTVWAPWMPACTKCPADLTITTSDRTQIYDLKVHPPDHPWHYSADSSGRIFSRKVGETQSNATGVVLPRLANQEDIHPYDLMDEIDVVYKPLQGEGAVPRRQLIGG